MANLNANTPLCRLYGIENAQTKTQESLARALQQAFSDEPAAVLVEPGLRDSHHRPPDLVLVHPSLGVHVFEVKGVEIDQVLGVEAGYSVRIDYNDRVYSRNPTSQARNTVFDIKSFIERHTLQNLRTPIIPWVLWPRITRQRWCDKFSSEHDWPSEWLFKAAISSGQWIARICAAGQRQFSEHGLETIPEEERKALGLVFGDNAVLSVDPQKRKPRRLRESTLGWYFDQRAIDYATLSEDQEDLIRQEWAAGPRLVRGVAGSGKTIVLASHLARRLKRQLVEGQTLFAKQKQLPRLLAVCFNRTLVPHLQHKIAIAFRQRTGGDLPKGCVDVTHFNGLMYRLSKSGVVPYIPVDRMTEQERSAHYLAALRECYADRPDVIRQLAYDAVYVDEGQDFTDDDYLCFRSLCRQTYEGTEPSLFIFYDDAQNLYGRQRPQWSDLGLTMVGRSFVMTESFRNTRPIIEPSFNVLTGSLARSGKGAQKGFTDIAYLKQKGVVRQRENNSFETLFAKRVDGLQPKTHRFSSIQQENRWLVGQVKWQIEDQEVRPEDLLILTYHRHRAEAVARELRRVFQPDLIQLATFEKDEAFGSRGRLTVSTVASAKGLDAYSVLLISAQDFADHVTGRAAFYVGCTRSREHLAISGVGHSPLADEFQAAVEQVEIPSVS